METYNAEKIIELGKMWAPTLIGYLDSKEVLSRYEPEVLAAHLKPEERVAGLPIEERLTGMSIEDIHAYLKRQEQKNGVNGH